MTNRSRPLTRRHFIKLLSAGAVLPLLARQSAAEETTGAVTSATAPRQQSSHRILCANILLASAAHDGTPFAWSARKELCLGIMKEQQADIICTQEVLRVQAEDMAAAWPNYQTFGFPGPFMDQHPDGYHGVTKNVILFDKGRYEMTSAGSYWLSETPLIAGSVSWDALRGRHVNWVRLKERKTGVDFRVMNTHFDHKGQQARVEQAKMIVQEAAQYAEDFPQILAGDFNATQDNPAIEAIVNNRWTDTYRAVHGPEDPGRTFHKMEGPAYKPGESGKIDFIFCRGKASATGSLILRDNLHGKYPSDHYFVTTDVLI